MSLSGAHSWLYLSLEERQKRIDQLYSSWSEDKAHDFLSFVKAPRGYGIYASIGPNYQYAIFGRDSIEVAEDLLTSNQQLAKEIILVLAHLQGAGFNLLSEEEPGKIHHEYRVLYFGEHKIPKGAQKILSKLSAKWGGTEKELLYYGTFDATPLFIRLVYRYYQLYGSEILDHPIKSRDGRTRPLRDHVRQAVIWMAEKITASPWGLLEYKRINPAGLYNQTWEDSDISYLHDDGTVANADDGIAAIELQGYAYDALRGAAEMVAHDEHEVNGWRHMASILRDNTLERLWMADKKCFAMGLDRKDAGTTRQIQTFSANVGLLLESDLLSLMPHHHALPYIEGIVRTLFTADFITPAGLRLRSLKHAELVTFADYHGSLITWPKETYDIAKGLRKHGFYALATLLEDCLLQTTVKAGEFYEFYFVSKTNGVKYHYRLENPDEPTLHDLGAANTPEPGQAWTISAILAIQHERQHPAPTLPQTEAIKKIETDILNQPHIQALISSMQAK